MSNSVLFFEPIFKEKIWGGNKLRDFGYDIPSDKTGECWAVAAHPNGQSIVKNGQFKGQTLGELWENHREIFGGIQGEKFPLLVKIIDAHEDLSVQVHPRDDYARENENGELGKTECWYILDCDKEAKLVYGINAKNKEELDEMIDQGRWADLLQSTPIKKGDFFYVPSGTVHALKAGTLVLEIQQNSDTTYRLYDYDRRDQQGNLRELHIEKSKDVIEVPFKNRQYELEVQNIEGMTKTRLIQSEYFTVEKYEINGYSDVENNTPFTLCSIIQGEGKIKIGEEEYHVTKGDHFMITSEVKKYNLQGNFAMVISHV
ncbi:mannose-6-phosphate isomerase, class I [Irregularibacter muris]|uniref:mannose-6-phosphate isomerase n=1 Tax=Irregularibacter muris TaxID=1796619 RepID=A0AAE3KZK2_9FIRM|nr:mannose-6-phosphate isomerase, class I [Irregularibacter muris]MCR1898412.1 mannose-6-phosphate isomerase, class I [Irregularibacter muris]